MADVVVDGFKKPDGPSYDEYGGDEQDLGVDVDAGLVNMDLDGQLTQEAVHAPPMADDDVGRINDDFDVQDFEREEQEEVDAQIVAKDDVSSDSDDSDDDEGAMRAVQVPVPHSMQVQGRLVTHVPDDDSPYDSWARLSEA